jgi:hypothetical protein
MRARRTLVFLLIAACGGSSHDNTPDAASSGADAPNGPPDAPACTPAIPTKLIMAAGGVEHPSSTNGLVLTESGELAAFFQSQTNGESAQIWDGTSWTTHVVFATSNGGVAGFAVTEADGHAAYMATPSDATPDSNKLRLWMQLASGDFATGQTVTGLTATANVFAAHYNPSTQVMSAAGGDGNEKQVYSYERAATGNWTVQYVHTVNGATTLANVAGVGAFADGTAGIVTVGTEGVWLYRRSGTTWSAAKQLVTSQTNTRGVAEFPSGGSTASHAVVVYVPPATSQPRVVFASTTDGTPTGDTLVSATINNFDAQVVFDPGAATGTILFYDYQSGQAWTAAFDGTSVAPAKQLRPDLVFEGEPRLVQHPCGGLMIMHATRAPTDAPGSASLEIEPLATFAP